MLKSMTRLLALLIIVMAIDIIYYIIIRLIILYNLRYIVNII